MSAADSIVAALRSISAVAEQERGRVTIDLEGLSSPTVAELAILLGEQVRVDICVGQGFAASAYDGFSAEVGKVFVSAVSVARAPTDAELAGIVRRAS